MRAPVQSPALRRIAVAAAGGGRGCIAAGMRRANVKFDTNDSAQAILLGIYQIGQPSIITDTKLTDTRSRGGGILDSVNPSEVEGADEALMFMDLSMWDGEPFPPTAIITQFPQEVLGTGQPDLRRDPSADPSGYFMPSGLLTTDDVQHKMAKHKAGGVVNVLSPEIDLNA